MYWTETGIGLRRVRRANLDGTIIETIVPNQSFVIATPPSFELEKLNRGTGPYSKEFIILVEQAPLELTLHLRKFRLARAVVELLGVRDPIVELVRLVETAYVAEALRAHGHGPARPLRVLVLEAPLQVVGEARLLQKMGLGIGMQVLATRRHESHSQAHQSGFSVVLVAVIVRPVNQFGQMPLRRQCIGELFGCRDLSAPGGG